MELEAGAIVDRYEVEALLGEGGIASVYRVRHTQLGTLHALKVLKTGWTAIRERLLQEGRVQARLQHPNIVAVTDIVEVAGSPGLLMEYVRGPTLEVLLQQGPLSLEEADALAIGIIAGVAAAHAEGLIHRDLKPANILLALTRGGVVPKVADFGLAKFLAEGESVGRTRTGSTMGTPAYMPPEQIRDARSVDRRADIFALGAILYELACGAQAFGASDILELFAAIGAGRYRPVQEVRPAVPSRMVDAIAGALQPDRDRRIADCDTLLAVWTEGGRVPARPMSTAAMEGLLARTSALASHGDPGSLSESRPSGPRPGTLSPAEARPSGGTLVPGAAPHAAETILWSPAQPVIGAPAQPVIGAPAQPVLPVAARVPARGLGWGLPLGAGLVGLLGVGAVVAGVGWWVSRRVAEAPQAADTPVNVTMPVIHGDVRPVATTPVEAPAVDAPAVDVSVGTAPAIATGAATSSAGDTTARGSGAAPARSGLSSGAGAPIVALGGSEGRGAPEVPPPAEGVAPSPGSDVAAAAPAAVTVAVAEPPPPEVPTTAQIRLAGDARSVWLQSPAGNFRPGEVPAGTYRIKVFFEGPEPHSVGEVTVAAGESRTLVCQRALSVCQVK